MLLNVSKIFFYLSKTVGSFHRNDVEFPLLRFERRAVFRNIQRLVSCWIYDRHCQHRRPHFSHFHFYLPLSLYPYPSTALALSSYTIYIYVYTVRFSGYCCLRDLRCVVGVTTKVIGRSFGCYAERSDKNVPRFAPSQSYNYIRWKNNKKKKNNIYIFYTYTCIKYSNCSRLGWISITVGVDGRLPAERYCSGQHVNRTRFAEHIGVE